MSEWEEAETTDQKTTHKEKETQKELLGGTREIRGGRNESNLKQKKREGE